MRAFLVIAPLLLLAGCGKDAGRKPAAAPAPAIRVDTVAVARSEWPQTYEATGTVRAKTTATVSSKLMGYVRAVRAQTGDHVREGQVLIVLDSRDLDTAVSRSEAAREEVKSAIPEADSGIAAAKAQTDLAQVTFNRMQDLFNKKSISHQEFDETSARLKAAQAMYDMARAKRAQLDFKLAQAEQEVRAVGINKIYSEITAPFSGTILTKSVEPGTLAVPGAPLLTLELDGVFRLEAAVEESRLPAMHPGKAVLVTVDGIDRQLNARIAEIVPSVDSAARAGTVKIDLPALPQLRSGLFGRALFDEGSRKAIAIPTAAVMERGQLQSVFVAESNVAHTRMVTLGARNKDQFEVLSGLNGGEHIVVPIPANLTDGAPVEERK